ncbi:DUF222 domain-containing protein [Mycetocola zhujimingii]|uniref:DUF222 domain-containing protein n=1 Tax=Mycetocola zhujimingii TaxID=2079792 RepID=UPI000D39018C|nr:DUF222 domain-containing protein [Mycetocola zhujimingii]AWB85288.1 hypothetical protein C3E77_00605 [Mycetocola zhujimingii]
MVQISEQIRQIAQSVCDRIAALEPLSSAGSVISAADQTLSLLIDRATDSDLEGLLRDASRLRSEADAVVAATAGVVAKRSARELGYSGLAKRHGDHNAVDMVQRLTGSTRVEAARQVKLGEAMGEADAATHPVGITGSGDGLFDGLGGGADGSDDSGSADGSDGSDGSDAGSSAIRPAPEIPWHEPLTRAVRDRVLKPEAVTIIMRGLGEPNERVSVDDLRISAEQLLTDAAGTNADELGRRARFLRDQIDPVGVRLRWDQHFENRKWRFSRSADGVRTAWVEFDDESAAYIDQLVGAGMRPRRGGPRTIDPADAERAQRLIDDPRSNDQLVFDLLMATLKAGAEADPNTAFGNRQPGVRIVITQDQLDTRDADGHLTGTGFNEDTGEAIPGNIMERNICTTGTRPIRVDQNNNPLDVGREQRRFTTKQRIALAIRDGGCVFEDCTRPPSYTEAHHINEWAADHGLTNIADGILVCREDHMLIHNNGWKIVRDGTRYSAIPPKTLDPEQKPRPLRSRSALKQAPPRALEQRKQREQRERREQRASQTAQGDGAPIPGADPPQMPAAAPRQVPGSPAGPASPSGTSRPANRDRPADPPRVPRRRESNRRVMETWYTPPDQGEG